MDDKLFGVVSTMSGLVLGWLLTELSYLVRSSRENRKTLHQVLFIQLEIRDVIKKTDLSKVEQQLNAVYLKTFPGTNIADINNTVGKLFYGFIQNELNNKFSKKIHDLGEEYKKHISTLAQVHPFITYSISNKDVVLDYLGYVNRYLTYIEKYLNEQVIVEESPKPEDKSKRTFSMHFADIADNLSPFLRETAIETIEEDIKSIAKKIGLFSYIKTIKFFKRTRDIEIHNIDVKKIEMYIKSITKKETSNNGPV